MARAMGTNAYGKEPRRGERTLSRGFTHRRARRAFLRPYGAGASLGRSHRAYALGYFLAPLTGLRTAHAQDWHDAKNSASRRRRGLKCRNSRAGGPRGYPAGHARFLAGISRPEGGSRELPMRRTLSFGRSTSHAEARSLARREKSQQIGVHFVLVGRAQAVRRAWIGFQRGPFDQLGREQGRGADRHDLVVVAMDDESGYVELLEILGEVRLGERFDAVEDAFETSLHALQPERVPQSWRDIGTDTVEHLDRQPAGIGRRLEHQRGHGGDQHSLGHALRAVAADIAGNFAAAHRMADVDRVLHVERFDERREVIGEGVHIVAAPGLAGPAMTAAVVGDRAVSVGGQKYHLVVPCVGCQRPAMAEDNRLSLAPILVVDLGAVFSRDRHYDALLRYV